MEEFLFHVHMSTWGAMPSYFFGMLMWYSVSLGHWKHLAKNVNHLFWIGTFLIVGHVVQYMPIIHNTLDMLPDKWIPAYIVGVRMLALVQMAVFMIYFSLIAEQGNSKPSKHTHSTTRCFQAKLPTRTRTKSKSRNLRKAVTASRRH